MEKKEELAQYIYDNISAGQCRECNTGIRSKPADMIADDILAILDNTVSKSASSDGLWRLIDTAPKDMTEILGWREDAGVMLIRWTAPIDFLTESELDELDEETADAEDWFFADFVTGGRLEGSEAPTHWMPLPEQPEAT